MALRTTPRSRFQLTKKIGFWTRTSARCECLRECFPCPCPKKFLEFPIFFPWARTIPLQGIHRHSGDGKRRGWFLMRQNLILRFSRQAPTWPACRPCPKLTLRTPKTIVKFVETRFLIIVRFPSPYTTVTLVMSDLWLSTCHYSDCLIFHPLEDMQSKSKSSRTSCDRAALLQIFVLQTLNKSPQTPMECTITTTMMPRLSPPLTLNTMRSTRVPLFFFGRDNSRFLCWQSRSPRNCSIAWALPILLLLVFNSV